MHKKYKTKQSCAGGVTRETPLYAPSARVRRKALYPCMRHNLLYKSEYPTSDCYRSFYAPGIALTMLPGAFFPLISEYRCKLTCQRCA